MEHANIMLQVALSVKWIRHICILEIIDQNNQHMKNVLLLKILHQRHEKHWSVKWQNMLISMRCHSSCAVLGTAPNGTGDSAAHADRSRVAERTIDRRIPRAFMFAKVQIKYGMDKSFLYKVTNYHAING